MPLLDILGKAGAPIGRILRESQLPESFREGGEGFIPFRTILHFIGHSARSQGIPDLCWQGVLRARADHLGGWGEAVAAAPTLRRAILTFCERFGRDAPLMQLGVDVDDDCVWFWRRRPKTVIGCLGEEEGQQYALAAMVRVVRGALGPDWLPRRIRLESAKAPWAAQIPGLANCELELRAPVVVIAVPYAALERSNAWPKGIRSPGGPLLPPAPESLAGSLRVAFSALLPVLRPSLEVARTELRGHPHQHRTAPELSRLCGQPGQGIALVTAAGPAHPGSGVQRRLEQRAPKPLRPLGLNPHAAIGCQWRQGAAPVRDMSRGIERKVSAIGPGAACNLLLETMR